MPGGVQILAKTANQVLSGHFSGKVRLGKGVRVVLEDLEFVVGE